MWNENPRLIYSFIYFFKIIDILTKKLEWKSLLRVKFGVSSIDSHTFVKCVLKGYSVVMELAAYPVINKQAGVCAVAFTGNLQILMRFMR